MHPRLPYDVLEEIFKYLSEDINSLHTFLLINKLWCQIVIRILWKNPWSYCSLIKPTYSTFWPLITRTIVSMIPQDSKNYLLNHGIDISKFQKISKNNNKFPMFNYLSYCKYFSLRDLHRIRREILDVEDSYKEFILEQVIYKLFLSNTCSLNYLELLDISLPSPSSSSHHHIDISHKSDKLSRLSFAPHIFPSHITHLEIKSHFSSSLLITISEYVNTLRMLTIDPCDNDNPGLSQLIKSQKCLTDLTIVSLNGVFENLSNAIKEKAKMIKCIRFVGNVCISSEAIYSLNELKVLEVDLLENNGIGSYLNFEEREEEDDKLQQQQEIYFNNNWLLLKSPNFPQLEILNILYDDKTSLSNYTSIINSTQNSKSLKKIFINDWFTIEFNELRPYLRSIINNCGICNNLKFVKIWYSRLLLPEIEDVLKKCTGLESIVVTYYENNNIYMDNIYNIDNRDNIMNFVEDITNERDTELFLDLLSTHSPITLNKIELNGDWRITKKILHKFLENWNSRKELGLEMNICALGFFQDCSKILKEYTDKGVLKKFSYE